MFDTRMAIDDHGEIVHKSRTPLRNDHHVQLARGGYDLLPLIAARLIVAFNADGSHGIHTFEMKCSVL